MGVRNDLARSPRYPTPLSYRYSVKDALPWIETAEHDTSGLWSTGDMLDRPSPTITVGVNSLASHHYQVTDKPGWGREEDIERGADISRYAIGSEWDKIGPGGQSEKYFQLVRPDAEAPSPTITASGGNSSIAGVTHPTERRKFSIAELKRICAFPDDFELTGTYAQQWERLGRSVPPVMMAAVARAVQEVLDGDSE